MRHLLIQIDRILAGLSSRVRKWSLAARGVQFDGQTWLRAVEVPRNHWDIRIGQNVALDRGVVLLCSGERLSRPRLTIGARTYVNRNTMFDATCELTIGEDCAIGPGCYITDHDHGMQRGVAPLNMPLVEAPTRIGARVWIGANVTVLKGVTIGDDAVVGAGAVVTRDLPPGARAVGVPAKPVSNI